MKKVSSLGLGATFAGCFLGAGFISGQEIFQFFASFGIRGFWGLALALLVMVVFGILLMTLAHRTGIQEMDRIVVRWDCRLLRILVGIMEVFLLVGVFVIMTAGASSLLSQVFGLPMRLAAALFCLVVALAAMSGVEGMVRVFSLAVPALTLMSVVIAVWTMTRFGLSGLDLTPRPTGNPLLSSWWISGLTFVSYNLFGALGALTPLGVRVPDEKTARRGILLGSGALALIAVSILLSFAICPEITAGDLPMLDLARKLNGTLGFLFALLLLCGMFGTSLSGVVAVTAFLRQKRKDLPEKAVIFALAVLAWMGSLVGFGNLIAVVYPICGYFGLAALVLLAGHAWKIRRNS